eukprot:scaffold45101_cov19-Tisochrysis_lutea.AAC.1
MKERKYPRVLWAEKEYNMRLACKNNLMVLWNTERNTDRTQSCANGHWKRKGALNVLESVSARLSLFFPSQAACCGALRCAVDFASCVAWQEKANVGNNGNPFLIERVSILDHTNARTHTTCDLVSCVCTQAALAEYAAAAAAAHVPVPLPLQRLRLDLLLLVQPPAGPHQPPCSHFLRFATPTPTSPTATVTHAVHSEQLPAPPTLQPHLLAAQLYCQWGAVDPSLADHLEGMLARFCATTPLPPPLQRLIHATRGKGAEGEWEEPYGGVWEDHDWLWEDQGSSPSKCMAAD